MPGTEDTKLLLRCIVPLSIAMCPNRPNRHFFHWVGTTLHHLGFPPETPKSPPKPRFLQLICNATLLSPLLRSSYTIVIVSQALLGRFARGTLLPCHRSFRRRRATANSSLCRTFQTSGLVQHRGPPAKPHSSCGADEPGGPAAPKWTQFVGIFLTPVFISLS